MPLMSWRNYVGIATDKINATLTSALAAAASPAVLSNTVGTTGTLSTGGATYSITFMDGPNTETVACTANLITGSIAIATTANAHPAGTYVYFQLTASVGPTAYIPVETVTFVDTYDQLANTANVGSAVSTIGYIQGVRQSEVNIAGAFFPDTFGYILGGLWGSADFATGPPKTHKFAVLNAVSTLTPPGLAYEPVPYLIYQYNAFNTRVVSGRFTESVVTFDPKAAVKYTAKLMGRASGVVATPASTSFSTETMLASWNGFMTLGGTVDFRCQSFVVTMTRESSEAIPVLQGNQDPATIMAGPMKVMVKATLYKDDDTVINDYINETQPAILLTATRGTSTPSRGINFQFTSANLMSAASKVEGKTYVTEDIEFEAIANTTDANTAGGGLSPGQVLLTNATGAASFYT